MAYTKFGEFVRVLRIRHHEVMGDMAKVLDVKVPFLSAVENGKKNVPADWAEKLAAHYGLDEADRRELAQAIEESRTQYKIPMGDAGVMQRKAALQFARSFDEMDDEMAMKLMELLSQKEDKNRDGL